MRMTETSKEYAQALFMLAQEETLSGNANHSESMVKTISDALNTVSSILKGNPEYMDLLASPNIPMTERLGAVDAAFSDCVTEYVVSFIKLLCEKGHIRIFHKCVSDYDDMYHSSEGISTAKVISAVPLTAKEKEALQLQLEKYCGHTVIIKCSHNRAVLGGMIVHIDGKILDGSLRRRLHDIKEVMNQ